MAQYTLRQLEYFIAAAEAGTLTGAAQQIHLSQSALSNALVELERGLGVQLFLRHHAKGVTLTTAGEQIFVAGRQLLKQAAELAEEAHGLGSEVSGTLHLACFGVLAPYILPDLLAEAAARLPGLTITTSEVDLAELVEGVVSGRFELAIGYDLTADPRLEKELLHSLSPYALFPHDHPLAGRGKVALAELRDEPMALLDLPHSRDYFADMFHSLGIQPTVRFRSTSAETCRAIVARGLAYTLLNAKPQGVGKDEARRVVAVDVADDAPPLDVALIKAAAVRPTRRMAEVQSLVRDLLRKGAIRSMFEAGQ
ncbi:LysR family transcriptional regulator [Streptomyces antnestii]|uniref:LysR family transcriptional regulator n=1 Tax=Streptomyces antnestii TaxID=2494256 RepID=A0A3S2Z334_9ACTN|nr:LysR family transcriptional regulator [Streptomyces sp. San01]RVU28041.1 LysR family transcriptional regulator [Streptomyces sp. San01]